jgi:hypothetical protein
MNKPHYTKSATADYGLAPQILDGNVQVLQHHSPFQLLAKHAHDVEKHICIKDKANARFECLACRGSPFLQEKTAFAKVVPTSQCAQNLVVFFYANGTLLDKEEVPCGVVLFDYDFICSKVLLLEAPYGAVDLLLT